MDWRAFVSRNAPALEPAVADELAGHLSDLYDEAIRDGLSPEEADGAARAAFASATDTLVRDVTSARRTLAGVIADKWTNPDASVLDEGARASMFTDLSRDVRYAVRMLVRAPGLTAVIALTLAIGIGANSVVFSGVDAVLLRAAQAGEPDRLVSLYTGATDGRNAYSSSSFPDVVDIRESGVFRDVAAFGSISLSLTTGEDTSAIAGDLVTGNYFDVLQVRPALGRTFASDEDVIGRPVRVAVVSDDLWRIRLGADRAVPGLPIILNGESFVVVGVMPPGFTGPILGRAADVWVPAALQQEVRPPSAGLIRSLGTTDLLGQRGPRWLNAIARLQPGDTPSHASAGLDALAARLRLAYPDTNGEQTFTLTPLNEGPGVRQQARPILAMLGATVVMLLLIACTNVASLMVGRALSRRQEMAIRLALGSRPQRIARQWLTESVVLAAVGGVAGLGVAWLGIPLLYQIGLPPTIAVGLDLRVVAAAFTLAVVTGLVFGLAPLVETLRRDTVEALRDEGAAVATGHRASRMRRAFVVAQVTLSLVLLVGAGLFVRSLQAARHVDLGYGIDSVVLGAVNPGTRYDDASGQAFYRDLLDRVRELPGVSSAALARVTVLSGAARTVPVAVDGPATRDTGRPARTNVVSDGYFDTLGIRLVRGRTFTTADAAGAQPVAVITERMADAFWPGIDPLGREFYQGPDPLQVVGIVSDNVYVSALELDPLPVFYQPLAQHYESGATLHVRVAGTGPAMAVVPAVRRVVRELDPTLPLAEVRSLSDEFDRSLGDVRLMATLVGIFGALAALLAAIGLYGVMAGATERRRTEIGLRLALGADRRSIFGLVLRQGLGLTAVGAALGLAGALGLSRLVESQLFGVSTTDLSTYAGVLALIFGVALLACVIPARRAMRVDPITALRGN